MQTLYIDVYFLINLTVDALSFHFAFMLSKIPRNIKRITISSILGSLVACSVVFITESETLRLLISMVTLIIMCRIASGKLNFKRFIKLLFSFLIFEALVGALVTLLWGFFDEFLGDLLRGGEGNAENPKLLFFSLVILLSIGVFKMLVSFFSNISCEGAISVRISFFEKSISTEAFIDSGNLAKDPLDSSPVLFIKEEIARKILPDEVIELKDPDRLCRRVRRRIRLIPISRDGRTRVLIGVKADLVTVECDGGEEALSVTVAIDKEGGDFGGYLALMPSAALENVVF